MNARSVHKGCCLLTFGRWVFGEVSFEGMVSFLGVDLVAGFPGLPPAAFWQKPGFEASVQCGTAQQCRLPFSEGPVSLASCYFGAQPGSGSKNIKVRVSIIEKTNTRTLPR